MRKTKLITLAAKYRKCPNCKESAPYDISTDFVDADTSDEMWRYYECRLCWHKDPVKPKKDTPKRALKAQQQEEKKKRIADLVAELMSDK
jgi:DNA-directed RNA polymerase subunit RPC12/RpoP